VYADDLLPQLVTAHPQYATSLDSAWAAARHWELVEPHDAPDPAPRSCAKGGKSTDLAMSQKCGADIKSRAKSDSRQAIQGGTSRLVSTILRN
jgi:hypothetical protein